MPNIRKMVEVGFWPKRVNQISNARKLGEHRKYTLYEAINLTLRSEGHGGWRFFSFFKAYKFYYLRNQCVKCFVKLNAFSEKSVLFEIHQIFIKDNIDFATEELDFMFCLTQLSLKTVKTSVTFSYCA